MKKSLPPPTANPFTAPSNMSLSVAIIRALVSLTTQTGTPPSQNPLYGIYDTPPPLICHHHRVPQHHHPLAYSCCVNSCIQPFFRRYVMLLIVKLVVGLFWLVLCFLVAEWCNWCHLIDTIDLVCLIITYVGELLISLARK